MRNYYFNFSWGYFDIGNVIFLGEVSYLNKRVGVEEREFLGYLDNFFGKLLFIYFNFSNFILFFLS